MMKWNYVSKEEKSHGYEDVLSELKQYTKERYALASDEEKEKIIEDVFKIYRSKNIFPIYYFNKVGIKKEIEKCIKKDVEFKDGTLDLKFNQGSSICKFLFPNLHSVQAKVNNNSMLDRFNNDDKLKYSIKYCLRFKKSVTPSELFGGLQLSGGNPPSSFNVMKSKCLYEKYCPKNGVIYDYACGFGSRMLGALSSTNNYTYIGAEPCKETYTHLNELGGYIEEVTGRKNSYKIVCKGSEEFDLDKEIFDFAFSSPCYFSLERYSDEETQSYNKFPTLDSWIEGFVRPTIQNIYDMLKEDRYYAVNINDFNLNKDRIEYVDKWIEISKQIGFKYIEKVELGLQTRTGNTFKENGVQKKRSEGIYIFKK